MKPLPRGRSSHGAIAIHIAFAMAAAIAFTAMVADYGIMWVARGQAQNTVDAAAHAAATAIVYDGSDTSAGGLATQSALTVAQTHRIWGQTPDPAAGQVDVTYPACPPNAPSGATCVRVNAYRNQTIGNPLPVLFGGFVGVATQGVRATATASIAIATASDCLKPFGYSDRYDENNQVGGWDPTGTQLYMAKYSHDGPPFTALGNPDVYIPPSLTTTGTGYQLPRDLGTMRLISPTDWNSDPEPHSEMHTNDTYGLEVPRSDGRAGWSGFGPPGGTCPASMPTPSLFNATSCNGIPIAIGDCFDAVGVPDNSNPYKAGCTAVSPALPRRGRIFMNMSGGGDPQTSCTMKLTAWYYHGLDPTAKWDSDNKRVVGGCSATNSCPGPNPAFSPRILTVPVIDLDVYEECRARRASCGGQAYKRIVISNITGLFIGCHGNGQDCIGSKCRWDATCDRGWGTGGGTRGITGWVTTFPGQLVSVPTITNASSFLKSVMLVQ